MKGTLTRRPFGQPVKSVVATEWGLLSSLTDTDRREILDAARRRAFGRGEVLVHEGDPADSLHLIAEGRVAVGVSTPSGEQATLNILSQGDYFGELSLVRRDHRTDLDSRCAGARSDVGDLGRRVRAALRQAAGF